MLFLPIIFLSETLRSTKKEGDKIGMMLFLPGKNQDK